MMGGLSNLDPALKRAWHPLCRSSEVTSTPASFELLGERYVSYRSVDSTVRVFLDR
jgi:phenylpropionate dioxygenase-like ring-hydroxylating dioxygenase large terminal subunit